MVVLLPLLSYPLSLAPLSLVPFRFSVMVPIASAFLAVMLLALARRCWGTILEFPRGSVLLPAGAVLVSALVSIRFSEHPAVPELSAQFGSTFACAVSIQC